MLSMLAACEGTHREHKKGPASFLLWLTGPSSFFGNRLSRGRDVKKIPYNTEKYIYLKILSISFLVPTQSEWPLINFVNKSI